MVLLYTIVGESLWYPLEVFICVDTAKGDKTLNECHKDPSQGVRPGCMTIPSDNLGEESVSHLSLLVLKCRVPVTSFVIVELIPLSGGNEYGTFPKHKILVRFRVCTQLFDDHPDYFYTGVPRDYNSPAKT